MRKFMFGFIAALFVMFTAVPASAETQESTTDIKSEQEFTSSPVECTFHNFSYPTVPEEWAYRVGDSIDFEITLSDSENRVERIVFSAGPVGKHGYIEEIFDHSMTWSPTTAGEWPIYFQLFGADGVEIIPTGNCRGAVKVLEAQNEPAHPNEPDVVVPPAPEPQPQPNPVDDTCADDDPSTLVPVSNPDGSTTWYSPGGAFCGTLLPKATNAPVPVQPAVKPAVQPTAVAPTAAMAELPRTGIKETLPLYGTGMVLTGFLLVFSMKKYLLAQQ